MSLDALLLVLAGALAHASWNYLAKLASGGQSFVSLYSLVSFVLAGPLCLWFFLTTPEVMSWQLMSIALFSALIHIFYSLALQRGYQVGDLTVVYPIARGTGPLFSVFGAILVLGERPSLIGWFGIGIILLGVLFIAGGRKLLTGTSNPGVARGLKFGVLTGLFIAAYTVVDGWSVKTLHITPIVFYSASLSMRTLLLMPVALSDRAGLKNQWHANWRYIVAVGLLSPLAYTLVLYAMTLAPLSYVAPIRELSMMIAALLGAKLLMEEDAKMRIAGSALMAVGVVVLTLA
jgi:drug/metabolite transporter (DMT)-like permease